jgi:hypothetical protein
MYALDVDASKEFLENGVTLFDHVWRTLLPPSTVAVTEKLKEVVLNTSGCDIFCKLRQLRMAVQRTRSLELSMIHSTSAIMYKLFTPTIIVTAIPKSYNSKKEPRLGDGSRAERRHTVPFSQADATKTRMMVRGVSEAYDTETCNNNRGTSR